MREPVFDRNSHSAESKTSALLRKQHETGEQANKKRHLTCDKKVTASHRKDEQEQEERKRKIHVSNGHIYSNTFHFIRELSPKYLSDFDSVISINFTLILHYIR